MAHYHKLLQTAEITNVGCYKLSKTQVAILIKRKKGMLCLIKDGAHIHN